MRVIRGRVVTSDAVLDRGWVAIEGAGVADVGDGPVPAGASVVSDLGDRVVAPGLIDVHVHGGGGAQVSGADPAEVEAAVRRLARFHARHGTTCLVAATVSDTPGRLLAAAEGVGRVVSRPEPAGAAVAGVHLEGPWLALPRRGAHSPECLRLPTVEELDALVEASGGTVRLVTIAPELAGASEVIAAAVARGITVSVGHTESGYDTARRAFDAGARHLTHLGNAMAPLDRREPGPIGAALTDPRVTVEVIADGHHVHPALLLLVAHAAPGRMVAVTDAIAAAGLPEGAHHLGRLQVAVEAGRVTLAAQPGTLAGSVLTMDRAVATLVAAGVPLLEALGAASANPGRLVGPDPAGRPRGSLAPGSAADIAVLGPDLSAQATVVGGRVVSDPRGLLAAFGSPPAA